MPFFMSFTSDSFAINFFALVFFAGFSAITSEFSAETLSSAKLFFAPDKYNSIKRTINSRIEVIERRTTNGEISGFEKLNLGKFKDELLNA